MTRRVHTVTGERKETSRAWAAWCDYRDMPPGQRSLGKLLARYRNQAGTNTPPPTRRLDTLKEWSQAFHWQARLAVHDAELDVARKAEMQRQVEQQARENARLMQQVGSGALALAAVTLKDLVDSKTGELRREVQMRDLPQLMRIGAELVLLSTGQPTHFLSAGDSTQLERLLREGDPDTREAVLRGMRAALEWQERHGADGR